MLSLLSGITVIEVANTIAAAYAGRLLADLGAEVIALEPPGGNRLRADAGLAPNLADYLMTNKRSACLELDAADGGRLARTLAERAQILLYDATVPALNRWLLDERVYEASPVALAVVTPYGLASPYGDLHADELLQFALGGIASVTPEEPDDPQIERPMQLHGHQASFAGGLTAAVAAMQGWFSVQASGQAVLLDIAVLDALASMPIISQATVFAGHPPPKGMSRRPLTVPRGFLRCREGYVYTQGGDDNWGGWARLLERPDWLTGPMAEPSYRESHWAELISAVQSWLDRHPNTDVYRALQRAGVTAFPVNVTGQVVEHPQIQSRAVVQRVVRAGSGDGFLAPRTAVRVRQDLMETQPDTLRPLGADTDTIREALHA